LLRSWTSSSITTSSTAWAVGKKKPERKTIDLEELLELVAEAL